ncbi:Endoribonuclease YBEY, chloroplastic [Linum perenne]
MSFYSISFSLPLCSSATTMARPISHAASLPSVPVASHQSPSGHLFSPASNGFVSSSFFNSSLFRTRCFHVLSRRNNRLFGKPLVPEMRASGGGQRRHRKVSRKATVKRNQKELEIDVSICIEDGLPDDEEIQSIAELLRLNVPKAMKLALDVVKVSSYVTRDTAITGVDSYDNIELSVMLCNDSFIRELNKEWRDEDRATDVLSMSQHVPELKIPVLMLGDVVISVETAARQAEERAHSLLDEIQILLVHGLLHLLGFDHEISKQAEAEMRKEEEVLLKTLGWKGKGLIQSLQDADCKANSDSETLDDRKKEGSLRFYKPNFKYIFCDMDGTLLNSRSQLSTTNANALKEAMSRGVKVVIATGKARPAVINILKTAGLAGKDGIVSESSPGVFLQGLLIYGSEGQEIFRRNLDPSVCREVCQYSLEHKVPLMAFSNDRCFTLFDHPLVDSLHTIYQEPKAEVIPSVEQLVSAADIQVIVLFQKLLFIDTADRVANEVRPYWSEATGRRANVVQAISHMLEIVPVGTSKGSGVQILLDHLGATAEEIMALGDGENDIEMLKLASLGIALRNGSEKTKAVADIIGISNDEDGVADAIYRYAF